MTQKSPTILQSAFNALISKKEPISLIHFVTNRCNARCSFCFIDFDNENIFKDELNLEEIENLTKSVGKSLLNVNFTGGEPFARKDLIDIAELYIKNTTIKSIYVTTNGSLPERIQNFANIISKKYPWIELTFQISIDDMPEQHNKVRKINNLFDNCIDSFERLKKIEGNVNPVVSITVTNENCDNIENIYHYLTQEKKINSIKCTIVRDEGVFITPIEKKKDILDAFTWLTEKIKEDSANGIIQNYNTKSLQGRLHNKKDKISWEMIKETYLSSAYISPCHAGSLFGIISSKGAIYPCEILEDKKLGDLRENEMNFMKIWNNKNTLNTKKFIKETKCRCSYECGLTYNILGNWKYQPKLMMSAFFNL